MIVKVIFQLYLIGTTKFAVDKETAENEKKQETIQRKHDFARSQMNIPPPSAMATGVSVVQ